jgi:hypothetical protein
MKAIYKNAQPLQYMHTSILEVAANSALDLFELNTDSTYVPYATCGCGSPGAMKLVSAVPVFLAAEQRAMVGELHIC